MLFTELVQSLPKEDTTDYRSLNKSLFASLNKTCFVIDDDPTGNQTVYDVPLLTSWDLDTLILELKNKTPICFILTNSRSLSSQESEDIYSQVTKNIVLASEKIGRDYTIISRSDSTLRGHFPSEPEAIQNAEKNKKSTSFLIPMMFEGGRITANDIHYIKEEEKLIPVNESPFSKDHTFGYTKANLKEWIEEKTEGRTPADSVKSISLKEIRNRKTEILASRILEIPIDTYAIVNAINYQDLDKICHALLLAEQRGKKHQYRTSSSFVPSYIGQPKKKLLDTSQIIDVSSKKGGLIIVGSYVSKTSSQLSYYLEKNPDSEVIELDVNAFFETEKTKYILKTAKKIDNAIRSQKNVIVYTSRGLKTGKSIEETIQIASVISNSVIEIVQSLSQKPLFLIAKGGITSHDVAVKGLDMKRSLVIGQVLPGIPVWRMGRETKFPELPYIVFPGNVGNEKTLNQLTNKITKNSKDETISYSNKLN